jgi:hypothetical protein
LLAQEKRARERKERRIFIARKTTSGRIFEKTTISQNSD